MPAPSTIELSDLLSGLDHELVNNPPTRSTESLREVPSVAIRNGEFDLYDGVHLVGIYLSEYDFERTSGPFTPRAGQMTWSRENDSGEEITARLTWDPSSRTFPGSQALSVTRDAMA